MQNLDSNFFIYNSTGKIIFGDEDSNEYSGLAKQIDSKSNALYFEFTENENRRILIMGCSVRVEQVGGREERIVCVGIYSEYSGNEHTIIKNFYERVILEVNKLQEFNYKIIGLWKKNDLKTIETLQETQLNEDVTKYIFGKLVANEKISIKSGNTFDAVLIINTIFQKLQHFPECNLKFTASQYPYESDISVCPIEPNPDFELENLNWKNPPMYREYYLILSKIFQKLPSEEIEKLKSGNRETLRESLSFKVKDCAFRYQKKNILSIFFTLQSINQSINKLFELYKDNDAALTDTCKMLSEKIRSIQIEDEIAFSVILTLSKKKILGDYEENILKTLYLNIKNERIKKKLDIELLTRNIVLSYAINDIICRIIKEDSELLHELFDIKLKNESKESFKNSVTNALSKYGEAELIALLKFIANTIDSPPSEGGKLFHESLKTKLTLIGIFYSLKLSSKEAESLDNYFGTQYAAQRKKEINSKRKRIFVGSSTLIIGLIIVIMGFIFIQGVFLSPSNNSSSNESFISDTLNSWLYIFWDDTPYGTVNITANSTSGKAPLTVQFTSNIVNATEWKWDIDGDGSIDYDQKNPVHTYNESGSYNVSLYAWDNNNSSFREKMIINVT